MVARVTSIDLPCPVLMLTYVTQETIFIDQELFRAWGLLASGCIFSTAPDLRMWLLPGTISESRLLDARTAAPG